MLVRVDPQHAGPNALGILVPHGAKTPVIVRPRALTWDLLPAHWDGDSGHPPHFCVFTRDEAAAVARRLITALATAIEQGVNPVQTFGDANGACLQIWLRTDEFVWIVCRRAPGLAYQPLVFATQEDATHEAEKLATIVWPAADVKQEYYFNTQNFG
jgi:hypothetical protein